MDGTSREYTAEKDSLHPGGALVLAREVKISELSESKEIKIVAVVSLYNVIDMTYAEIDDA